MQIYSVSASTSISPAPPPSLQPPQSPRRRLTLFHLSSIFYCLAAKPLNSKNPLYSTTKTPDSSQCRCTVGPVPSSSVIRPGVTAVRDVCVVREERGGQTAAPGMSDRSFLRSFCVVIPDQRQSRCRSRPGSRPLAASRPSHFQRAGGAESYEDVLSPFSGPMG